MNMYYNTCVVFVMCELLLIIRLKWVFEIKPKTWYIEMYIFQQLLLEIAIHNRLLDILYSNSLKISFSFAVKIENVNNQ